MSLRRIADHALALRRLPRRVAVFYLRALLTALVARDRATFRDVTRPFELALLLDRAHGSKSVVELGTGPAWTSVAFALADDERRVVTIDPKVYAHRARYLALVGQGVRARIDLRQARGEDPPPEGARPDLVFIDSRHEREPTVETFNNWEPVLQPGGLVAFHDYGNPHWPGVAEAVRELGLDGEPMPYFFFWRKP